MALNKRLSGAMIINHKSPGFTLDKSNQEKAMLRRKCAPGFPVKIKFKTQADVSRYFEGDKLQCLLCGRWFKSLSHHLKKIHNIGADEYKKKYGLPYNRGLTSAGYHSRLSCLRKDKYESGQSALSDKAVRLKGTLAAKGSSRRLDQPFNKNRQKETHRFSSQSKRKFKKEDILRVLDRARKTGRTIRSVCADDDMPSYVVFYTRKKEYGL